MKSDKNKWEHGALSEKGPVRNENQDRMSAVELDYGKLFIVADGMGGHKGGALAAHLTIEGLVNDLRKAPRNSKVKVVLQHAFANTNNTIYEQANSGDPNTEKMGSTAVLLLTHGASAHVAHVGDSRAYLCRQGKLQRLTKDHTKVQRMLDAGILTPEEALEHPDASVLDRVMGNKPNVEVDIETKLTLKPGDGILLCSDGLSGSADDSDIEAVLRNTASVQEIPKRLYELALDRQSEDNITIQFIQYGKRFAIEKSKKRYLNRIAAILIAIAIVTGIYPGYGTIIWNLGRSYYQWSLDFAKEKQKEVDSKVETAKKNTVEIDEKVTKARKALEKWDKKWKPKDDVNETRRTNSKEK